VTTPQDALNTELDALLTEAFPDPSPAPAADVAPPAPAPAPAPTPAPAAAVEDNTLPAGFEDYLTPAPAVDPTPTPAPVTIAPAAPAPAAPAVDPTLQSVLASNAELSRTLQRLMEGMTAPAAAAPAPAPAPLYDPAELQLSDEERKSYESALPVINKTVRAALSEYHRQAAERTAAETTALKSQISELQAAQQTTSASAFMASVRGAVTDFDARVASPEWKQYLSKAAPLTGGSRSMEQVLQSAIQNRDTASVIEIVKGFQVSTAPAAPPQAPGSSRPSVPTVNTPLRTGNRMFALSKFVDAGEKVRTGQMPYDKYVAVEQAYLDAAERGLVDENA
jgi:hypothetical protein